MVLVISQRKWLYVKDGFGFEYFVLKTSSHEFHDFARVKKEGARGKKQGPVVRKPNSAIHWIAVIASFSKFAVGRDYMK